jgi:hypothetical protein
MTRPVVRLELGGRPVLFTRIQPESRSTSLLIRCVGCVCVVCVCGGGGGGVRGGHLLACSNSSSSSSSSLRGFTRIQPESRSTSLLIRCLGGGGKGGLGGGVEGAACSSSSKLQHTA